MHDIFETLQEWHVQGKAVALATVTETWGSAPRAVGSKMAVTADGKMVGSVSGGCVEGAVVEAGLQTLATGVAQRLQFGVADETAWSVGLACGGKIEVFVEPVSAEMLHTIAAWQTAQTGGAIATIIAGEDELIGRNLFYGLNHELVGHVSPVLDDPVAAQVADAIEARASRRVTLPESDTIVFVDLILPQPQLLLIGGGHISVALAQVAKLVEFDVVVIDPRRAFANEERFPSADQVIQKWPKKAFADLTITASTAVAVLTHDPKIDDPALEIVLRSPAFYIGVLGSSRTQAKRRARFIDKGFSEAELDRIYGPIGLDIRARTPEEIALAIMGQIIAAYRGG